MEYMEISMQSAIVRGGHRIVHLREKRAEIEPAGNEHPGH